MESGRPSSRPSLEDQQRLEAATGNLRDALGSIRNLAELLHSVRVGPKAISVVLPAVHGACEPIEKSMRTLLDVIAVRLPDPSVADDLLGWVAPRAAEIERELALAMKRPMNARTRLDLEHVVIRLSRELEGARALLDVLNDAVRGSAVRLSAAELIREASRARESMPGPTTTIQVRVAPGLAGEVLANPRVAIALLGVGARLVAQSTGATPFVTAAPADAGGRTVVLTAGNGTGDILTLPAPPIFPPTLKVAEAAAEVSGATLGWDRASARFSLTFTG